MWGFQTYSRKSSARDNPVLALFTYGEGYHNYHHTFQWDYRNGIKWWHFDPTKWMIRTLSWFGLTRDLKRCSTAQIEKAKLELQYQSATERCLKLDLSEKLRNLLEQEYEQLQQTLQLWSEHRQAWYEVRGKQLQESLNHWEILALRDRYHELQFKLRMQRKRWRQMIRSLADSSPAMAIS